jgi:hypothetical protein
MRQLRGLGEQPHFGCFFVFTKRPDDSFKIFLNTKYIFFHFDFVFFYRYINFNPITRVDGDILARFGTITLFQFESLSVQCLKLKVHDFF